MFHNPTAAVNLFHVGKQYLTFCKAEAAVTHNVIGRKIISNVKHLDARNSLPILDVIRCKSQMPYRATVRQSTANERYVKRQMSVIRIYTCSERHLTFRRNIDTRRQWSVGNIPDEMSGYIGRHTPSQWGNYTTIACSITPLPPWIYFTSENSIWRSAKPKPL